MWLVQLFRRISQLFLRKRHLRFALYGPPNSGKTTLANRICTDWLGEEMGSTSPVAHETRRLQMRHGIRILHQDGRTLTFSLVDTPGLASRIDYRDFVSEGLSEEDARERAREAADGVLESIDSIDEADAVIVVLDSTKEPGSQVNTTLIDNLEEREMPIMILANKTDLHGAGPERIREAFSTSTVVPISAKYGDNMEGFYNELFTLTRDHA